MNLDRRQFLAAGAVVPAGALAGSCAAPGQHSAPSNADTAGAWIEVDLSRVRRNLARVRARVRGRRVMAVVKANAYGHGLVEVARCLAAEGADAFMVGNFREAVTLRHAGIQGLVLNFGPFPEGSGRTLVELGISQVVFTRDVEGLAAAAKAVGRRTSVHVLVDTGLGRLGVPHDQASGFIESVASLRDLQIEGVMTDLSEDAELDRAQLDRFLQVCERARGQGIELGLRHAASSDAVVSRDEEFLLDMVRPGILLYGHQPSEAAARERVLEVEAALSLKARVALAKRLKPGDAVSYHRAFVAREETDVATLPLGYSDGFPVLPAGKGTVLAAGRRHALLTPATANHVVVRVDGGEVRTGDEVVLIGDGTNGSPTAEDLARDAGVSVYRILIGLNPLVPRFHRGA
jgi:alanine racemase